MGESFFFSLTYVARFRVARQPQIEGGIENAECRVSAGKRKGPQ
jgi:hypothetical protein